MSYAIVGFSAVGQALARAFARKNIEVAVASRRPPEALAPQARAIGATVVDYCSFLNKSWKMSRPQMRPRACTSAPPSLSFPSLTGANPSCLAKAATGAVASSSSLDRKMTRWPPSTIGSAARAAAGR